MKEREILTCFGCKQKFRKSELVSYASARAKILHNYCAKCLEEKKMRENFSDQVCFIFGIKSPGPVIWKQRQILQTKYGYTDETIIKCLDYIYNVKKMKKLSESLVLVKPSMVEEMMQYQRSLQAKSIKLAQATNMETKEYVVPMKKVEKQKIQYNPDDWLED